MLEWIYRGLSRRRVTTGHPARPEPAPPGFHGRVDVRADAVGDPQLADVCPTGAIAVDGERRVSLDAHRCILCGECVRVAPELFAFRADHETAVASGKPRGGHAAMLRRSLHVRHIDCGSDGSEEWEIQALWNPHYDIQRLGFFLTSSPRHADVLLVTGPVTAPMCGPLERTWQTMPEPKALVAVGTDACGGGLHRWGAVDEVLPVDVYVPGSPPSPIAIIDGLLRAASLLAGEAAA